MVSRHRRGSVLQDVRTLFDSGTTVGLSDGELLGRFADRHGRERNGDAGHSAGPAFAALVERHGPMVLRVCRSVLRDEHDAQDAFQATFLVLVRRARAVRRQQSVGSWLHGVALRVSCRARADLARRRRHERGAAEARIATDDRSHSEAITPELAAIVHEELGRLPEHYRVAVVLCYLEGHTCEAAARRLGWPVGTVKSRLARGRERLRGRLIRRGLAPVEMDRSPLTPIAAIPAALVHSTVEGMVQFASRTPATGAVSATALSWTVQTLRTMHMTRLALIAALLIAGLAATGAAMLTTQHPQGPQARSAAPSKEDQKAKRAEPEKKVETLSVRVIDTQGRSVPDIAVELIEEDATPRDDGSGPHPVTYRTDADGRVRVTVDPHFRRVILESRPDERAFGWASLRSGEAWPKAIDADPIKLTLLSRNHPVEGTIVDTRGKPIRGVQVRAVQFDHLANGFARDHRQGDQAPSLASTVTDETGHYRLTLPQDTIVIFAAYHTWFVGPRFSSKPDARTIPPVTMEDAGGIAGTVVDAATGRPVSGAHIGAQRIVITERILGGGGGSAVSDAQGHFLVGGLAPGVHNLVFGSSPMGRRFMARAVEGVRVQAGREARADLRMIEGRRLQGKAIDAVVGEPVAGERILAESKPYQGSGAVHQSTFTDDQGRFELFVPPGPTVVSIASGAGPGLAARRTLNVPNDRAPEPVILERGYDSNAGPAHHPPPSRPIKCEVRVRVKAGPGDRPAPGDDRTLTGRIFDKSGSPLPAIRVDDIRGQMRIVDATDRLGVFRLKGLPQGEMRLRLLRDGVQFGSAIIPAEAVEVDLIVP
jgi:RNA polymerase sigma factor (sigma-70 family)